jgi:hypothetical protein
VQDADEPAGELVQGGVVLGAAGALGVVEAWVPETASPYATCGVPELGYRP